MSAPLSIPGDNRAALRRVRSGEQHTRRRRDSPVETKLADRDIMRHRLGIGYPDREQQPERDRQVEVVSFLGQISGRQVDRDPLGRKREPIDDKAGRTRSRLSAIALSGSPTMTKAGSPADNCTCTSTSACLESEIGNGGGGRDHQRSRPCRHQH